MPAFFRNSQESIQPLLKILSNYASFFPEFSGIDPVFFENLSSRIVHFSTPAMAGLTFPSEIVLIIRGFRSWGQKTMPLFFWDSQPLN